MSTKEIQKQSQNSNNVQSLLLLSRASFSNRRNVILIGIQGMQGGCSALSPLVGETTSRVNNFRVHQNPTKPPSTDQQLVHFFVSDSSSRNRIQIHIHIHIPHIRLLCPVLESNSLSALQPIQTAIMNYDMEDSQNSAPGSISTAQATKLGANKKTSDTMGLTKR